jgi:hypothetical protein
LRKYLSNAMQKQFRKKVGLEGLWHYLSMHVQILPEGKDLDLFLTLNLRKFKVNYHFI